MFWYGIFEELFKAFGHGIVQLIISFCVLRFFLLQQEAYIMLQNEETYRGSVVCYLMTLAVSRIM